jgi:hypothetical protein
MNIEQYLHEFTQELMAQSGADENFTRSSFIELMCQSLDDEGFISSYTQTDYKNTTKGIAVDAWSLNEEMECLTLIIGDYRDSGILETLTKADLEKLLKRLSRFVQASLSNGFCESLEEAMPVTELGWMIRNPIHKISKISMVVISNAELSASVTTLPNEQLEGYITSCDVWDIGRIYRANTSGKSREDIWIDFGPDALPSLPAFHDNETIQSYLIVVPGEVIANLYQEYGERLLEQNVRTFLQFRGSVNKGIRNTIANEPQMFFSYNNGLAATADAVVATNGGTRIQRIKNLQIVNGGQTTASIFTARRKEKLDLKRIYVQVKLSVVPTERVEEIVPRISQFANTQNKVNAADFFSNHPFHLRIEEFSRRLWAPAPEGKVQETHWFYERARGQYANQQANLSPGQQKKFLGINPKSQMFTKTDLCKFILTFAELPHEVSLGSQKAFSGSSKSPGFVSKIAKEWEQYDGKTFNELWFKEAIAKAIFFRQLDKSIYNQIWYRGYKANIVTYTLSKFANMVAKTGKHFDYLKIWQAQKLPDVVEEKLLEIAQDTNEILVNPPIGRTSNVTEWSKSSDCWELVKNLPITLGNRFSEYLIHAEIVKERVSEGSRAQTIEDSVHSLTYVVEKGSEYWSQLREWNISNRKLTPKEMGILDVACDIPQKIPSEKQTDILVAAEKRAIENGFFPSL